MVSYRFYSKNYAVMGEHDFDSQYVPRVGEIVYAKKILGLADDQVSTFIVEKVVYFADKKEVSPTVYCHQWWKGSRSEMLMERGWLPTTEYPLGEPIYDEESL